MPVTPLCVACDRPTADGYACTGCTGKARGHLAQIADMTPAARDIAHRQTSGNGGGGAGKPGSSLPLDLGATARLDAVDRALTRWVDRIGTQRGTTRPWFTPHGDRIITAAEWLAVHLEWIRHQPDHEPDDNGHTWGAQDYVTDIAAAARIIASVACGPAEKKYLGPCGAHRCPKYGIGDHDCAQHDPCDGDIYGRPGADKGTCRTCEATVDQAERRIWLDEQVRSADLVWTAVNIADALSLNVKTVRTWANQRIAPNGVVLRRAKLGTFWRDGDRLVPWADPRPGEDVKARGDRLHYVADVIDLAEQAAAERERRAACTRVSTTAPR